MTNINIISVRARGFYMAYIAAYILLVNSKFGLVLVTHTQRVNVGVFGVL